MRSVVVRVTRPAVPGECSRLPDDILLGIQAGRGQAVRRQHDLVAAEGRLAGGGEHGALGGGAGDDHGADAVAVQPVGEIGAQELVGSGLHQGLARPGLQRRRDVGRRAARDVAVDHLRPMRPRLGQQTRDRVDGGDAARPAGLVTGLGHEIEQQQGGGARREGDIVHHRRGRRGDLGPVVDHGLRPRRRGCRDEGQRAEQDPVAGSHR